VRIGVDRDEDDAFDRDELDAGASPTDPTSLPASAITCDGNALVHGARVRIARNLDPAGDERLTMGGRFQVSSRTPTIDLLTNVFRFRVDDKNDVPLFARVIPGGAAIATTAPGWSVNRRRDKWTYKDFDGTHTHGVTRVVVWDKSANAPGLFIFRVSAKNDNF